MTMRPAIRCKPGLVGRNSVFSCDLCYCASHCEAKIKRRKKSGPKKRLKKHIAIILPAIGLWLGLCDVALQAQTNLVENGSFEAGPAGQNTFTDWPLVNGADDNSNYGVTTNSKPPDVAEQGNYYAYFRGHPTDSSQDCLGTYLTLKVGGIYSITYYLGTDGALTNGAAMWAQIGPSYGLDPSQDVILTAYFPDSATALPYQEFSTNYVATSTAPILSFHAVNATNGIAATNAILLDNISMVQTYPPMNVSLTLSNTLMFSWPFANSPYRLQFTTALGTTNWVTLTNVPVNVGTNNQIALAMSTNKVAFYRLTLP